MLNATHTPACPECSKALQKVRQGPNSMLNAEQFDAMRAGDWFCETCPGNGRARTGYRYFWDRDLAASPVQGAASASDQGAAVSDEVLALHRQLAAETLRADQGWQRYEAKNGECLDLRAALAERAQAQPSVAVEIPPVICVGRRFPSTNEATVFFERDVSDDELLALNARLGAKLNNPTATPAPEQEAAPLDLKPTKESK